MFNSKKLSSDEINRLLNCVRLPGRVTSAESAALLGFHDDDIPILLKGKLLKPLGEPARNAPKYFAATYIETRRNDEAWLNRATKAVTLHWFQKNERISKRNQSARNKSSI